MAGKGYSREFQAMLDSLEEEDFAEENCHFSEKKRRLTIDQVKALEKNFEVENKLEPDRKLKLAEELGLQPRQVAIWFQNRRARWKTKQLERDFNSLKASYDALKEDYDKSQKENETLLRNVRELKRKLGDDNGDSSKEDFAASESENNVSLSVQSHLLDFSDRSEQEEMDKWVQISDNGAHVFKLEEQFIFSSEDSCNFFSVDQAPTLHWYLQDQ